MSATITYKPHLDNGGCHLQFCQLGMPHAVLELFRKSALESSRLHLVEDAILLQKVIESRTRVRINSRHAATP